VLGKGSDVVRPLGRIFWREGAKVWALSCKALSPNLHPTKKEGLDVVKPLRWLVGELVCETSDQFADISNRLFPAVVRSGSARVGAVPSSDPREALFLQVGECVAHRLEDVANAVVSLRNKVRVLVAGGWDRSLELRSP
jgi:hypothetical protein